MVEKKEHNNREERGEALVQGFGDLFINRWDWYAVQQADGSYLALHKQLRPELLRRHLKGEATLGVYALDEQGRARWLCFDADDEEGWRGLLALSARLVEDGVVALVESSRRGGHVWFFFEQPLPGRTVRAFARALIGESNVEVFPKQDGGGEGPGSLMRLPLGIHRRDRKRHGVRLAGQESGSQSLRDQLQLVLIAPKVTTAFVANVLAEGLSRDGRQPAPGVQRDTDPTSLIQAIKRQIDIREFVGRYVVLTQSGRGHCPFHDDEHMSFSVNKEKGYFHCFAAGCDAGGDVIIFYERFRGIARAQAVRDLARMAGLGR